MEHFTSRRDYGMVKQDASATSEDWVTVDVTCVGDEPMLCNPMSRDQLIAIGEKKTVRWPTDRPIIEQADEKAKLMMDLDGYYGFRRQWLIGALKEAGRNVETGKAAKQKISTATTTRLRGLVRIVPDCLTTDADGEKFIRFSSHSPYERDVRKGSSNATAGKSAVAVAIVRPLFRNWEFRVRILVSTQIEISRIRNLFEIAGSNQGLGDFRPGVGGEFGCFAVESFTVYKTGDEIPDFELSTFTVEPEAAIDPSSNGKAAKVGASA